MRVTLLSLLLTAATLSSVHAQDEPPLGVSSEPTPDAPLGVSSEPTPDAPLGVSSDASSNDPLVRPAEPDATDGSEDERPAPSRDAASARATDQAAGDAETEAIDAPSPAEAADEALAEEDAELDPAPAPARWTPERVAAWTTFVTSLGVAIAGGILLAVGVDDRNTVENAPDGTMWERVAGARDRAPILTGVGAALLGLGAAGTAVGAGLLASFGASGTWLEVSALPTGVTVRGRF